MQHNLDAPGAEDTLECAQRIAAAYTRALQAAEYTEMALTQALRAINRAKMSRAATEAIKLRMFTPGDQPARRSDQPK